MEGKRAAADTLLCVGEYGNNYCEYIFTILSGPTLSNHVTRGYHYITAPLSPRVWEIPPGVSSGRSQENDAATKTTTKPEVIGGSGDAIHMQEII